MSDFVSRCARAVRLTVDADRSDTASCGMQLGLAGALLRQGVLRRLHRHAYRRGTSLAAAVGGAGFRAVRILCSLALVPCSHWHSHWLFRPTSGDRVATVTRHGTTNGTRNKGRNRSGGGFVCSISHFVASIHALTCNEAGQVAAVQAFSNSWGAIGETTALPSWRRRWLR
jgi:hypothetical protein